MELQENQPHNRSPCAGAVVPAPCSPQACLAAFRFQPPHARIDWRALHGLDVEALVRALGAGVVNNWDGVVHCQTTLSAQFAQACAASAPCTGPVHLLAAQPSPAQPFGPASTHPPSQARTTDIDALERVLDVVAFGDIEAEDARNLTPLNFIKLFRLAQLTVEYLLFVQDRLAADNCVLKVWATRCGGASWAWQSRGAHVRLRLCWGR